MLERLTFCLAAGIMLMLTGCGIDIVYYPGWTEEQETYEGPEVPEITPEPSHTPEPYRFPSLMVFADRSNSIGGTQNFKKVYHTLKVLEDYTDVTFYYSKNGELKDTEDIRDLEMYERGSYLELLGENSSRIQEVLAKDGLFVFITDLETDRNIEELSMLLNEGKGTGLSFFVFTDTFKGTLDYGTADIKYENGKITEVAHHIDDIENAKLERYYLAIVYGKDEDVHVFDEKFKKAMEKETGLNVQHRHVTTEPVKHTELPIDLTPVPDLESLEETGDIGFDNTYCLFGTKTYIETRKVFTNPHTYVFVDANEVFANTDDQQIILYSLMDNGINMGANSRIGEVVIHRKEEDGSWTDIKDIPGMTIELLNVGNKLLTSDDEIIRKQIGFETIAEGKNDLFGIVLRGVDFPKGVYALEITVNAEIDYGDEKSLVEWAKEFSVSNASIENVMKDRQPAGNNEDGGLVYGWTEDMKDVFEKLKDFDILVKGIQNPSALHETQEYTFRLYLEKING